MLHLILGGARSGKSRYAEKLAAAQGTMDSPVNYIATADAALNDQSMSKRIEHHQLQRPDHWFLQETPLYLADTLANFNQPGRVVIIDCLTLWISNCLLATDTMLWPNERKKLLDLLSCFEGTVFMVSNEVGQGVIPMDKLARKFVDESGWLHQDLARICNKVCFVTAGIPQQLKNDSSLS